MQPRNYYVVLGVAPTETEQGIRTAFRSLAKRLHPDQVGLSSAPSFREVVEAYDVLRDPQRRREYDDSLLPASARRRPSMRDDLGEARRSEEAPFDTFTRAFTGVRAPRRERLDVLDAEVAISQAEADRGTRVRIRAPVYRACVACRGRGCSSCSWEGLRKGEHTAIVDVPPMAGRGATFMVPLEGLGVRDICLRVRVRVRTDGRG